MQRKGGRHASGGATEAELFIRGMPLPDLQHRAPLIRQLTLPAGIPGRAVVLQMDAGANAQSKLAIGQRLLWTLLDGSMLDGAAALLEVIHHFDGARCGSRAGPTAGTELTLHHISDGSQAGYGPGASHAPILRHASRSILRLIRSPRTHHHRQTSSRAKADCEGASSRELIVSKKRARRNRPTSRSEPWGQTRR